MLRTILEKTVEILRGITKNRAVLIAPRAELGLHNCQTEAKVWNH
jgi:hypothetical protein